MAAQLSIVTPCTVSSARGLWAVLNSVFVNSDEVCLLLLFRVTVTAEFG